MARATITFTCLLLTAHLYGCGMGGWPNADGKMTKEVAALSEEVLAYPDSVLTGEPTTISKPGSALVSRRYTSAAGYEDLRRFFIARLTAAGWQIAGERKLADWGRDFGGRELRFRRGEHMVAVTYAGEKADYAWDYVIDVEWEQ